MKEISKKTIKIGQTGTSKNKIYILKTKPFKKWRTAFGKKWTIGLFIFEPDWSKNSSNDDDDYYVIVVFLFDDVTQMVPS